jgi:hypothetical protein
MPPFRNNTFANSVAQSEKTDPIRIFLYCLVAISFLFFVTFYGLSYYFSNKADKDMEEIQNVQREIASLPLGKMMDLSKKISILDGIQKNETDALLFLKVLGDSIEKKVYITNMTYSVNKGNTISSRLTCVASTYEDVIKQIERLRSPNYSNLITKVELTTLSMSEIEGVKKVNFSLEVTAKTGVKSVLSEIKEKEEGQRVETFLDNTDSTKNNMPEISTTSTNTTKNIEIFPGNLLPPDLIPAQKDIIIKNI